MSQKDSVPQLSHGDSVQGVVITIYAAVTNEDRTEGRGKQVDHSYHLTEREATIGASSIGAMKPDGDVEPRLAVQLSDGRYALLPKIITIATNSEAEARLREQARAKLTPAELTALLGDKK